MVKEILPLNEESAPEKNRITPHLFFEKLSKHPLQKILLFLAQVVELLHVFIKCLIKSMGKKFAQIRVLHLWDTEHQEQ